MWGGTIDDLREFVEKTLQPLVDRSRADLDAAIQAEGDSSVARRLLDEVEVQGVAILRTYAEELRGPIDAVLNDLTGRESDVVSLKIVYGYRNPSYGLPPYDGFQVIMSSAGTTGFTFGNTRDWVDVSKIRIAEGLKRERPWYFWFRNPIMTSILGYLPVVSVVLAFGNFFDLFKSASAVWFFGAYLILLAIWMFILLKYWPRWVPKFELYRASKGGRGKFAVGIIVAALAFVAGSVIFPSIIR